MTARQPFTALCQRLARRRTDRVDLHIHTTASDGAYTPAEVVDVARRSGLPALAITDHDTLDGVLPARAAAGTHLEVIPGVEITAAYEGREFHLLGYFFHLENPELNEALERLRKQRVERFHEMVEGLRGCGVDLGDQPLPGAGHVAVLGRRLLAEMVVKAGGAGSIREAFSRYLGDHGRVAVPALGLPVSEAIALMRGAGGVAAWAHPAYDCNRDKLLGLRRSGLQAVEAIYPSCRPSRSRQLRTWAAELGLVVSGGSDCHGPGQHHRAIGASGITLEDLDKIRQLSRVE